MKEKVIKDLLKNYICEVTFNKVDGTERLMVCTANPKHIKKFITTPKTNKRHRVTSDEVLKVFDLDKQSWRSFRMENLLELDVLDVVE